MTSLRMNQFYKTKTCPWFFKGRCERGESCRFAHNEQEKRNLPDLSRTSFCPMLLKHGICHDSHCRFAHNVDQLRATDDMYKTSLCFMFMKSRCEAGSACRHAHGTHELRAVPASAQVDRLMMQNGVLLTPMGIDGTVISNTGLTQFNQPQSDPYAHQTSSHPLRRDGLKHLSSKEKRQHRAEAKQLAISGSLTQNQIPKSSSLKELLIRPKQNFLNDCGTQLVKQQEQSIQKQLSEGQSQMNQTVRSRRTSRHSSTQSPPAVRSETVISMSPLRSVHHTDGLISETSVSSSLGERQDGGSSGFQEDTVGQQELKYLNDNFRESSVYYPAFPIVNSPTLVRMLTPEIEALVNGEQSQINNRRNDQSHDTQFHQVQQQEIQQQLKKHFHQSFHPMLTSVAPSFFQLPYQPSIATAESVWNSRPGSPKIQHQEGLPSLSAIQSKSSSVCNEPSESHHSMMTGVGQDGYNPTLPYMPSSVVLSDHMLNLLHAFAHNRPGAFPYFIPVSQQQTNIQEPAFQEPAKQLWPHHLQRSAMDKPISSPRFGRPSFSLTPTDQTGTQNSGNSGYEQEVFGNGEQGHHRNQLDIHNNMGSHNGYPSMQFDPSSFGSFPNSALMFEQLRTNNSRDSDSEQQSSVVSDPANPPQSGTRVELRSGVENDSSMLVKLSNSVMEMESQHMAEYLSQIQTIALQTTMSLQPQSDEKTIAQSTESKKPDISFHSSEPIQDNSNAVDDETGEGKSSTSRQHSPVYPNIFDRSASLQFYPTSSLIDGQIEKYPRMRPHKDRTMASTIDMSTIFSGSDNLMESMIVDHRTRRRLSESSHPDNSALLSAIYPCQRTCSLELHPTTFNLDELDRLHSQRSAPSHSGMSIDVPDNETQPEDGSKSTESSSMPPTDSALYNSTTTETNTDNHTVKFGCSTSTAVDPSSGEPFMSLNHPQTVIGMDYTESLSAALKPSINTSNSDLNRKTSIEADNCQSPSHSASSLIDYLGLSQGSDYPLLDDVSSGPLQQSFDDFRRSESVNLSSSGGSNLKEQESDNKKQEFSLLMDGHTETCSGATTAASTTPTAGPGRLSLCDSNLNERACENDRPGNQLVSAKPHVEYEQYGNREYGNEESFNLSAKFMKPRRDMDWTHNTLMPTSQTVRHSNHLQIGSRLDQGQRLRRSDIHQSLRCQIKNQFDLSKSSMSGFVMQQPMTSTDDTVGLPQSNEMRNQSMELGHSDQPLMQFWDPSLLASPLREVRGNTAAFASPQSVTPLWLRGDAAAVATASPAEYWVSSSTEIPATPDRSLNFHDGKGRELRSSGGASDFFAWPSRTAANNIPSANP